MARTVLEFVGGPLCGSTDTLQRDRLPEAIGPYQATGKRIGIGHHRYEYQPLNPAGRRPPCARHTPPRPGCPGYTAAKPP